MVTVAGGENPRRQVRKAAETILSGREALERAERLVPGDHMSFAREVSRYINLQGGRMSPEALLTSHRPAFIPYLTRFLGSARMAELARWRRGSFRGPDEKGNPVAHARHATTGITQVRADQFLDAAKAVKKGQPKGFADARDFVKAVIAVAMERFGLDFNPDPRYVRQSEVYWPVIQPYCVLQKSSPKPEVEKRELPDIETVLKRLKERTLVEPNKRFHDILREEFREHNEPLTPLSAHLVRLAGGKGERARELKSLIMRYTTKRGTPWMALVARERLRLTQLLRERFIYGQTREIVISCRGGAAELSFLASVVSAGFLPSARQRVIDTETGDYLAVYRLSRPKNNEEFFVLYADTSVDYSTADAKIPSEEERRERIKQLACDEAVFPGTHYVVFSDLGWRGKWDSAQMRGQIERAREADSVQLTEFKKIVDGLKEAAGQIPRTDSRVRDIDSQIRLLETTIYLARSEPNVERRRARIEEAARQTARIEEEISATAGRGAGGAPAMGLPRGPASHRLPFDAMAAIGGGRVFPPCAPFTAIFPPPLPMWAGMRVW